MSKAYLTDEICQGRAIVVYRIERRDSGTQQYLTTNGSGIIGFSIGRHEWVLGSLEIMRVDSWSLSHLGKRQEVEEDPESPYVHGKVVSPFEGHLGREVFLCAAEGGIYPARRARLDELRATEISNNEMTEDINEDVLRFQVPMDDPSLVESIDRQNQFAGVKLSCVRA